MLKYAIAVAFLSAIVLGNDFSVFDREWNDQEEAFCVETCTKYCENCTEPVRCDPETEKKCGEKPLDPNLDATCSPDDICVPIECECKQYDV